MVAYVLQYTFDEVRVGKSQCRYHIVINGVTVASNCVPGFWSSRRSAQDAAQRHAKDFIEQASGSLTAEPDVGHCDSKLRVFAGKASGSRMQPRALPGGVRFGIKVAASARGRSLL